MNNIFYATLIAIILVASCKRNCTKEEYIESLLVKKEQYDSLYRDYSSLYIKYDSLELSSRNVNDSLSYLCKEQKVTIDSLSEKLFIAEYKLERIREYNRIAAQGNNITFLRGWINRVLND